MDDRAAKEVSFEASERSHTPLLRRAILSILAVAVLLAIGTYGFRALAGMRKAPERATGGPPLPVVRVETVSRGDHREVIRGYGVAKPYRQARVAAEIPGVVREVAEALRVGAMVGEPGPDGESALLVRIDARDLEDAIERLGAERRQTLADEGRVKAELLNFDAQLAVADKRLATARDEEARIESLVPATLTRSELDRQRLAVFALEQMRGELVTRRSQSDSQLGVIEARLDQLTVRSRQATRDLARAQIRAPVPGRVQARHVEVGLQVAPGTPLFDLVDPRLAEVGIALPASRHREVLAPGGGRGGSRVQLRLRPGDEPVWEGPISRIDPMIDPESRSFRVWLEIRDGIIAPGAPVIGDVEGGLTKDVLIIPREAFLAKAVYVAEPTDEEGVFLAVRRVPRVVRMLSGLALIAPAAPGEGIQGGDRVVVSNLEDIAEGSRIRTVQGETESGGGNAAEGTSTSVSEEDGKVDGTR
jgi:HlyD family secretion protein